MAKSKKVKIQFNDLPNWVKDQVMSEKIIKANGKLIKKFNLSNEQKNELFRILRKIILKEISPNKILEHLKSLKLDNEVTRKLALMVVKERLLPLQEYFKEDIRKIYSQVGGKLNKEKKQEYKPKQEIKLDQKVDYIIKKGNFEFESEKLRQRFEDIITLYLKGAQSRVETKILLKRNKDIGGLGFDENIIEEILNLSEEPFEDIIESNKNKESEDKNKKEKKQENKKAVAEKEKDKEPEKKEDKQEEDSEEEGKKQIKKEEELKKDLKKQVKKINQKKGSELEDKNNITPQKSYDENKKKQEQKDQKQSLKKEDSQQSQEDTSENFSEKEGVNIFKKESHSRVNNKKKGINIFSRSHGPIDELRILTLEDWRRWGDSNEAAKNIKDKIDLLGEESLEKKSKAIEAWKQSEIYNLYLEIGKESINKGKSIKEVIEDRKKQNKPTLTQEEFNAILDLSQELRF